MHQQDELRNIKKNNSDNSKEKKTTSNMVDHSMESVLYNIEFERNM